MMSNHHPTALPGPVRHILLAEDDDALRGLLRWSLEWRGYRVTESVNGLDLLDRLTSCLIKDESSSFALVISDIRMPGLTGLEILHGLKDSEGLPPMVLITGFGSPEIHERAERYGAVATLDKPFDLNELLELVERLVPPPSDAA